MAVMVVAVVVGAVGWWHRQVNRSKMLEADETDLGTGLPMAFVNPQYGGPDAVTVSAIYDNELNGNRNPANALDLDGISAQYELIEDVVAEMGQLPVYDTAAGQPPSISEYLDVGDTGQDV